MELVLPAVVMAASLALAKLKMLSSSLVLAVGWKEWSPRYGHMLCFWKYRTTPPPEGVEV